MTIQKLIKYSPIDIIGQKLNYDQELKLNISKESGNYLLHKDLLRHHTIRRQATSSTKTRSDVRGGGKKPWRQKGTGRARAGSTNSPLWKGGGVIFGPKPKKVTLKLNKKESRLTLQTLLYNKKDNIIIVENLEDKFKEQKTQNFIKFCKKCNINIEKKLLIIVTNKTNYLKLSTKNIKNVEIILASNLNTYNLLKAEQILLTTNAIEEIKEIYCG